MANFYVHDLVGPTVSYIRAMLGYISDKRMQEIQIKKMENDEQYRSQMMQNEQILTQVKIQEAKAKNAREREQLRLNRKHAEANLAMGLLQGIADVYQNGIKNGEVDPSEYAMLANGAESVLSGYEKLAKDLGLEKNIAPMLQNVRTGIQGSIQSNIGRQMIFGQMQSKKPQQFEAFASMVGGVKNLKRMDPSQIAGLKRNVEAENNIKLNALREQKRLVDQTIARTKTDDPMMLDFQNRAASLAAEIAAIELSTSKITGASDEAYLADQYMKNAGPEPEWKKNLRKEQEGMREGVSQELFGIEPKVPTENVQASNAATDQNGSSFNSRVIELAKSKGVTREEAMLKYDYYKNLLRDEDVFASGVATKRMNAKEAQLRRNVIFRDNDYETMLGGLSKYPNINL